MALASSFLTSTWMPKTPSFTTKKSWPASGARPRRRSGACDLSGAQAKLAHKGRAVELQARAVAVHEAAVLVPHHGLRVLRCHEPQPLAPKEQNGQRLAVASQLEHVGHRIDRVQGSITSLKTCSTMYVT